MDRELRLHLSEEDADAERLAVLTGYLRAELLRLDVVEEVSALPGGEPPSGAAVGGIGDQGLAEPRGGNRPRGATGVGR